MIGSASQLGAGQDGEFASGVVRWTCAIDQFTAWEIVGGIAETTRHHRRYQLRRLAEVYPRRSPWRLRTRDLVAWLSEQDSWAPETMRSYRTTLRAFYSWGVEAGHARSNPAARLPAVRIPSTLPRPTPEPVAMVALASSSDRDRLILALAAYAGLRRAEIAALRWDDVVGDGTSAHLRVKGKGGKVRAVPLHIELACLLELERARRDLGRFGTGYRYNTRGPMRPYIFPGQGPGHITPNAVGKAAARALGGGWGVHSLRHRFATRAYAGSRDLLALQALLGHAKPETTRRYTEISDAALADVVRAV